MESKRTISLEIPEEVLRSLYDFLDRLDLDTAMNVLSMERSNVRFSEPECEIKAQMIFDLYLNELRMIFGRQLPNSNR